MARQQIKKLAAVTTGLAEHRPSLRNGVTAYDAFAVRVKIVRRRGKPRCDPTRPSHPALNVRDDREAPLM